MVGGDDEARVHVEAVRVGPVEADPRVEVQLVAAEPLRLLAPATPSSAAPWPRRRRIRQRREVVDVERMPPGEAVEGAKPGHGDGLRPALLEGAEQAVALGALELVDGAPAKPSASAWPVRSSAIAA